MNLVYTHRDPIRARRPAGCPEKGGGEPNPTSLLGLALPVCSTADKIFVGICSEPSDLKDELRGNFDHRSPVTPASLGFMTRSTVFGVVLL